MKSLNSKKEDSVKGTIKINLPIVVTDKDIDDIMTTAMEGGIFYWCNRVEVEGEYLGGYASNQISRGGVLRFYLSEPISDEDPKYYTLDYRKLIDGIAMWLDSFEDSSTYGDVIEIGMDGSYHIDACNIDSITSDLIVQYALFGEEVFA